MARIKIELPERLPFVTTIPIRIGDINYGGHLGNDAVLSLAHEARVRWLASLGWTELDMDGVGIVMIDAAIVYESEGLYGDVLRVEAGAGDFRRLGCDFHFRISNEKTGRAVARVKTGIACLDRGTRKPARLPDAVRRALEA